MRRECPGVVQRQGLGCGVRRRSARYLVVRRGRTADGPAHGLDSSPTGTRRGGGAAPGQTVVQVLEGRDELRGEALPSGDGVRQERGQIGSDHEVDTQGGGEPSLSDKSSSEW